MSNFDTKDTSGELRKVNQENLVLLKDYCNNNKIQLIDQFKNFDIFKRKKITLIQFNKVLFDNFGNYKVLKKNELTDIGEF